MSLKRSNPRIVRQLLGSLLVWSLIVACARYTMTPHNLSTQVAITSDSQSSLSFSAPGLSETPALTTVAHAQALPGGPTGDPLPPGTLAPDFTYRNNYAWGQCTWYVAGRRQIPPNWGNAVSWYYHAISNGWKVGTVPATGAIAWTSAGYFGHVALVEQISADGKSVYISEMNYRGVGIKDYRWVSTALFKYIY